MLIWRYTPFNIKTKTETVQGISYKYCQHLHKSDGYTYSFDELINQTLDNQLIFDISVWDEQNPRNSPHL